MQRITGMSYRQSTKLLQKIREDLNKPIDNFVILKLYAFRF
jgi:hypothetical protein